ncbi:hypothetical protein KM043_011737 [Ampulex compressa]|nr:hypothetical protein KM043_011737 [Ampulex compressa]
MENGIVERDSGECLRAHEETVRDTKSARLAFYFTTIDAECPVQSSAFKWLVPSSKILEVEAILAAYSAGIIRAAVWVLLNTAEELNGALAGEERYFARGGKREPRGSPPILPTADIQPQLYSTAAISGGAQFTPDNILLMPGPTAWL